MMPTSRFLSVAIVLLLSACGSDPLEDGCKPGGDETLEIGLGENNFAALEDGETVPFTYGPQGGYHLELGLQATHLDAEDLISGSFEGRIDGDLLASAKPWLTFRCDAASGTQQSWGTLLIFAAEPAELHDVDADIDVEITDAAGTVVTSSLTVHIVDPLRE